MLRCHDYKPVCIEPSLRESHIYSVSEARHSPLPPHHTSLESSVTLLWESNAAPLPSRTLTRPTITGERFIGPTSTIQSSKVRATATSPSLVPETLQVLGPVPVTQTPSSSAISNANASVKEPSKTWAHLLFSSALTGTYFTLRFLQNTGVAVSIFVTIGLVLIIFGSFLFPFLRRRIKLVDPEHEGASSEVPPVGPPALSPGGVRDTTETFWENTEHRRLDDDRLIHAFSNDDVDARSAFSEAFSDETLRHTELSVSRSDEYPSSYPASILPEYSHTQRSLLLPAYSDMSHFERSSSQQTLRGARGIIVSYDATGTQLGIL